MCAGSAARQQDFKSEVQVAAPILHLQSMLTIAITGCSAHFTLLGNNQPIY